MPTLFFCLLHLVSCSSFSASSSSAMLSSNSNSSSSSNNPRHSSSQAPLQNIHEDLPLCLPFPLSCPTLDTPLQPMEFLSRSWSVSAMEVAKALTHLNNKDNNAHRNPALTTAPFQFASVMTSQIVMERILTHCDLSPFNSRRNSRSGSTLNVFSNSSHESPPFSPREADELIFCNTISAMRTPLRGKSVGRWWKEMKEKKKEATRSHNAQIHAAVSVAGVATAIAAIAAATAANASDDAQTKTSMAMASAAALVAAQCVEVAENMGADPAQVSSVVSSAVNVKTPGDVVTLTAAAATALRGAATLKARTINKEAGIHSSIICLEKNVNASNFSGELTSEESEGDYCSKEHLKIGGEFLKRSRNGELQWRIISVYLNKHDQVIVKSQSKYIGGAFTKKKKRIIQDLYVNLPAWPGRNLLEDGDQRRYFGIKTAHGIMELECKNEADHRLWTEGICHLLCLSRHQQR